MILFDHLALDQPSLQQHSLSLLQDHGKKISKQALDKRFNEKAVEFIQKLFECYLEHELDLQRLPSNLQRQFSAIRIMDSTEFKLPASLSESFPGFQGDGTSSCTQIQFEYDVLSAKIKHLSIENACNPDCCYAADHLKDIESGNLIIRDLGYSTIHLFKAIEERKAYYISRLNTQMIIYEKHGKNFKILSFKTIVQRLKNGKKKYLDTPIYIGKELKHPVRLIANLLDPLARKKRLSKKIYRKNSQNEKYKYLSQLNLFITNIPKEITPCDDVYRLYKIRWQIELIFKTWKSILKIDHVRKMKANRFKCYLISKLIWIMVCWDICMLFNDYVHKDRNHLLSTYKCFAILKLQVNSFKTVITRSKKILRKWLTDVYVLILEYGIKEERKGKEGLMNLLNL